MTNINKTIETILFASLGAMNMLGVMEGKTSDSAIKLRDETVEKVLKALKTQEQEHQKITDFLIESHAFDMKELKKKHQKKLKEINEFGGDETDAYNLIDKLNEEK